MEMDRAELRAQVASQLSMDEDDGLEQQDPSGAGAGAGAGAAARGR